MKGYFNIVHFRKNFIIILRDIEIVTSHSWRYLIRNKLEN
jgi:hypothetical protein